MHTFILSGDSSILTADIYPPVIIPDGKKFVLGLINFESYNSIPNIYDGNDKFYIDNKKITIPVGSYDIESISQYLNKQILIFNNENSSFNCTLRLKPNLNTLQTEIKSTHDIDFSKPNSFASLLGFDKKKLLANVLHISEHPVRILKVNAIKVECNITTGSYENGALGHAIHEFFPSVPSGFKIIEAPQNVIYLPINTSIITNITIKIVDQDGDIINFRGETVTVRLHLKEV